MKNYRKDFREIASKRFWLCIALTALTAYGFAAFNATISMDDLQADYYLGSENIMLRAGRYAMTLLGVLFRYTGTFPPNSSTIDLLAVAAFVWAAVNYCILMRRICGERFTQNAAILFVCGLISYPLIIEIWEFTTANLSVAVGYLLVSFALLLLYDFFHGEKDWKYPVIAAVLLQFVCAGYESLAVVYVFGVFMILFLQVIWGTEDEANLKTILLQGIFYAGVLLAGLILQKLVHSMILVVGNLEAINNGQREIFWLSRNFKETLLTFLAGIVSHILLKGIIYFPITELVVSCVVFLAVGIVLCRKKGAAILLPWTGMYLSLIFLPLLQGTSPAYRNSQVYGIFVAFVLAFVCMAAEKIRFSKVRAVALFLAGFLCLQQALYTNHFLSLNHYRYEAEKNIVADIGNELQRNFDREKPVVFIGGFALSDKITESASISENSLRWKVYEDINLRLANISPARFGTAAENRVLPQTVITSVIAFGVYAPNQKPMQNLFSYNGYDYVLGNMYYDAAIEYVVANNIPSYPQEGYIADMGECIVVHLHD